MVTDVQGEYRFTLLNPGGYTLTVSLAGFSTYQEEGLLVAVGGTTERNIALKLATVAETITVSGESPMVDPRQVGVTANFSQETLKAIGTRNMGFYESIRWAPGVAASDPGGTNASVSVLGSTTTENSILYEGVPTTSASSGGYNLGGSPNAVEEVQIVTLGASAEYQVAQGAVFNTVLKSGSNIFRGDADLWGYSDQLTSKPFKEPCNCDLGSTGYSVGSRVDFGATFGGPIVRDKLWFFTAYVETRRTESNPGIDPRLPRQAWNRAPLIKANWRPTDAVRVQSMFQAKPFFSPPLPSISMPWETINGKGRNNSNTHASELNWTLSNSTLVMVRFSDVFVGGESQSGTGDNVTSFRRDTLTGLACCGIQNYGGSQERRHQQQAKINHYRQGERITHEFRVGVQFEESNRYEWRALPSGANYTDVGGRPDQATFRAPYIQGADFTHQGVWAEDQMTIGRRLTVMIGARFDRMNAHSPELPAVVPGASGQLEKTSTMVAGLGDMFTWNAAPVRVGANFKLTEEGKTIVRGTYGRAYRPIFLNDFSNVHPGLSPTTLARWNPATNSYSTIISVTSPIANLLVDPDSTAPFTDQYSVGFDHELIASVGVGISFVHKKGQDQFGWRDVGGVYGTQNVTINGQTMTVFPLLNATSARRFLRTNGPGTFSRYNGVVLSFDKRLSNRWQTKMSYTYGKGKGRTTTQQDPNGNINADGFPSSDRPHAFLAEGSYNLPWNAQVAANFMSISGTPYAPQAQVQLPQGRLTINIAKADGTYRLPSQQLLWFRYLQTLFTFGTRRLDVGADLSNALQDTAHTGIVSQNIQAATFGEPDEWVLPRRMRFQASFKW
jgi:hypothetical protein